MRFTNVRIPRDNLLDRFATVDRGGKYSSPYSPSRRFAATLGELTGGRVGLTCGSLGVLKVPFVPLPPNHTEMILGPSVMPAAWPSEHSQGYQQMRICRAVMYDDGV